MTYKLRVCPNDKDTDDAYDFFERFMDECGYRDNEHNIDFYLKEYGAKNLYAQPFIEFETEAHATLFLLRWA